MQPSKEYQQAILTLLKFEQASDHPDGRAAVARVLLSLYQPNNFDIDVALLFKLPHHIQDACVEALRGRLLSRFEPHIFIKGGSRLFPRLVNKYGALEKLSAHVQVELFKLP